MKPKNIPEPSGMGQGQHQPRNERKERTNKLKVNKKEPAKSNPETNARTLESEDQALEKGSNGGETPMTCMSPETTPDR